MKREKQKFDIDKKITIIDSQSKDLASLIARSSIAAEQKPHFDSNILSVAQPFFPISPLKSPILPIPDIVNRPSALRSVSSWL